VPDVLSSLVPVFLVIMVGWITRITRTIEEGAWAGFEKVTYHVLFPAVIIETLAKAELTRVPILGVGGALIAAILSMTALLLAVRRPLSALLRMDGPAFTSLFQGATRWNTFVALAVAGSIYGAPGLTVSAVAIAAMIPLLNVLAIAVLSRYAAAEPLTLRGFVVALVKNPFVWSCMVGIALNLLAIPLPKMLMSTTEILGKAALAAGLLVVGAGLDVSRLHRPSPAILVSVVLKLALMPVFATGFALAFGVSGVGLGVVVISTSVPTAGGAYILARQMGGDAPLMAEILTLQTLAAMLTMPVALVVLAG
jgi:malonate transporter